MVFYREIPLGRPGKVTKARLGAIRPLEKARRQNYSQKLSPGGVGSGAGPALEKRHALQTPIRPPPRQAAGRPRLSPQAAECLQRPPETSRWTETHFSVTSGPRFFVTHRPVRDRHLSTDTTHEHGAESISRSRLFAFFDNRLVRALGWLVVVSVFISGIVGGYHRGRENQPDWRDFSRESQYVWQHREIPPGTSMFGYLPAAFMALWPFTQWTPPTVGLVAFIAANTLAAAGACFILYRWWFLGDRPSPATNAIAGRSSAPDAAMRAAFVWPLFLSIAHIQHVLQANQFTLWVLLLCAGGLTLLRHRHDLLGGLLLGLGVCIKVTPAVFLVYLALRRQWKALAAMILAVIVFDVVPSVIVFGADGAVREHRMWLRRAGWYSNSRLIEEPSLRIRRHGHNCAYSLVLARWLRPPPPADYQVILHGEPPADVITATRAGLKADEYLVLDPMPTPGTVWSKTRDEVPDVPQFRLAQLPAPTVWWIWAVTLAGGVAALAVATHRRRRAPPASTAWAAEAGLWMLLMLWLSPMMRDYYLALALPAYIVLWRTALSGEGTAHGRRLAAAAIAICYLSVLGLSWDSGTFYGLHLGTLAVLTAACAGVWRTCSTQRGDARRSP